MDLIDKIQIGRQGWGQVSCPSWSEIENDLIIVARSRIRNSKHPLIAIDLHRNVDFANVIFM